MMLNVSCWNHFHRLHLCRRITSSCWRWHTWRNPAAFKEVRYFRLIKFIPVKSIHSPSPRFFIVLSLSSILNLTEPQAPYSQPATGSPEISRNSSSSSNKCLRLFDRFAVPQNLSSIAELSNRLCLRIITHSSSWWSESWSSHLHTQRTEMVWHKARIDMPMLFSARHFFSAFFKVLFNLLICPSESTM